MAKKNLKELKKFPFCVNNNFESKTNDGFLSEKICCFTRETKKTIIKKIKTFLIYAEFGLSIIHGVSPQIGLPVPRATGEITTVLNANLSKHLSKQIIIDKALKEFKSDFTETEINSLYDFSIQYETGRLTKTQLISRIKNLRGGAFIDVKGALLMIAVIIIMANNITIGFQANNNARPLMDLGLLHPANSKQGYSGYGTSIPVQRSRSIKMTQTAGSGKENPQSGWTYVDIMKELKKQSGFKNIEIRLGDEIYRFKNPEREPTLVLQDLLAEEIYSSIRKCDTDISDIASNLGYKADNIKLIKDHVFLNNHNLDFYDGQIEYKRFDALLEQALAWKRMERGIHDSEDINWLKHEYAEQHYEIKRNCNYKEAHTRATRFYNGYPWDKNIEF